MSRKTKKLFKSIVEPTEKQKVYARLCDKFAVFCFTCQRTWMTNRANVGRVYNCPTCVTNGRIRDVEYI